MVVLLYVINRQTREETIKWKKSIEEEVIFLDGARLTSVLVENKIY